MLGNYLDLLYSWDQLCDDLYHMLTATNMQAEHIIATLYQLLILSQIVTK